MVKTLLCILLGLTVPGSGINIASFVALVAPENTSVRYPPIVSPRSWVDITTRGYGFVEKQVGDQNHQDIGQLDFTPQAQTFSGSVSGRQSEDYYHFSLQAKSTVNLRLSGLTNPASFFLGNEDGSLIAKSNNPGTRNEVITIDLEPGSYVVLIRSIGSVQTSYTLRLQADFIVEDIIVSTIGEPIRDPEFDVVGDQVAWIDDNAKLLVAPINPQTGLFDMDRQEVVDQGLAPFLEDGIQNGPEWVYGQDGSQIVYTLLQNNEWYLGRAHKVGSTWEAGVLEDSLNGHVPFGSLNPADEIPLIKYSLGSPTVGPRRATAWRELDNPESEAIITGSGATGGRWIDGERALTFSVKDSEGFAQIARYDVDNGETSILTSGPTNKSRSFAWHAPELGRELIFMATEVNPANPLSGSSVGIYREINGVWRKIKTIQPPSENQYVGNTDFFVFDGKSYILLQMLPRRAGSDQLEGAEIWIAGFDVDNDQEFYRKVTDGSVARPNDPEHFVTESQVFIYYTDATRNGGIIHRVNTGLTLASPPQEIGPLRRNSFPGKQLENLALFSRLKIVGMKMTGRELPEPSSLFLNFSTLSNRLKQSRVSPKVERPREDVILATVSDSLLGNARDVYSFSLRDLDSHKFWM